MEWLHISTNTNIYTRTYIYFVTHWGKRIAFLSRSSCTKHNTFSLVTRFRFVIELNCIYIYGQFGCHLLRQLRLLRLNVQCLLTWATRHYQDTESCKDYSTKGWIICFIYIFPVTTTFARNTICLCHIRHDASGWHFSRNGTRVGQGINAALFRLDRWMWVIGKDYPNYRSMK